jgi:hypothetical protein
MAEEERRYGLVERGKLLRNQIFNTHVRQQNIYPMLDDFTVMH